MIIPLKRTLIIRSIISGNRTSYYKTNVTVFLFYTSYFTDTSIKFRYEKTSSESRIYSTNTSRHSGSLSMARNRGRGSVRGERSHRDGAPNDSEVPLQRPCITENTGEVHHDAILFALTCWLADSKDP